MRGLMLSPAGQTIYRLDPYRERVFAIRELNGYRVEFVRHEGEAVTKILRLSSTSLTERSKLSGR